MATGTTARNAPPLDRPPRSVGFNMFQAGFRTPELALSGLPDAFPDHSDPVAFVGVFRSATVAGAAPASTGFPILPPATSRRAPRTNPSHHGTAWCKVVKATRAGCEGDNHILSHGREHRDRHDLVSSSSFPGVQVNSRPLESRLLSIARKRIDQAQSRSTLGQEANTLYRPSWRKGSETNLPLLALSAPTCWRMALPSFGQPPRSGQGVL